MTEHGDDELRLVAQERRQLLRPIAASSPDAIRSALLRSAASLERDAALLSRSHKALDESRALLGWIESNERLQCDRN